jgi:PAS domain S-box-containing protein
MALNFVDHPGLFRSLLEELPVGIYILDREQRIRFWNRTAELLTGQLAHEVVGRLYDDHIVEPCDSKGAPLSGEHCPLAAVLKDGQPRDFIAHYLHKQGHRVPVRVRSRSILYDDAITGAIVLFEEAGLGRESEAAPLSSFGCLDSITGVPSHRLTRAFLDECIAEMERSHRGFGLLRIRVLGLDEFCSQHGRQSSVPFLRTTAQTLRLSLESGDFLGRWGEDEFIAVRASVNLVAIRTAAETMWSLITHSEVGWWGDRFRVRAVITYGVAQPGDKLEQVLNGLEPAHAVASGRAVVATAAGP